MMAPSIWIRGNSGRANGKHTTIFKLLPDLSGSHQVLDLNLTAPASLHKANYLGQESLYFPDIVGI